MEPESKVDERKVKGLIEKYKSILRDNREDEFSEEDVKSKFLNPLLEVLGWNVRGLDEVKFEQRTLTGRTDFGLRLRKGGSPVLFVEAKSLSENLDGHKKKRGKKISYPQQAIDDAWSMKVDWVILTNFKKLRLYYSHIRKPKDGLQFELKFDEFLSEKGAEKLKSLSKEAVKSGSLQRYEKRRTREDVNTEIVNKLYKLRKELIGDINEKNDLTKEELRESVQRILDRLVVIRVTEDEGVLHADSLHRMVETWKETSIDPSIRTLMKDLKNLFRDFDSVYNSKLFEEHLCEDLDIENEVVEKTIGALYEYNFDLIDADVLGAIYEDYIGHTLEEKGEGLDVKEDYQTRKKSGIYYTPGFVVDFLMDHTLGELIRRTSGPKEVSKINVLDPACGSGSFLIKAFDYLKNYYDDYNRESKRRARESGKLGDYNMVTNINKKVLNENLYGADLDEQAAEIASVNLMLKGLQKGEKLPLILGDNIKVGNSLISEPIDEIEEFFDNPEARKPMLWEEEFPEVFQNEGFHVMISNPPYFSIRELGARGAKTKFYHKYLKESEYWKDRFRSDSDIYYYFMIQGLKLLREKGHFGFIVENYWLDNDYADRLREFILSSARIKMIVHFGDVKIFPGADNDTCLLLLQKEPDKEVRENNKAKIVRTKQPMETNRGLLEHISGHLSEGEYSDEFIDVFEVNQGELGIGKWILSEKSSILDSLKKDGEKIVPLADVKERHANSKEFTDITSDTLSAGVCITGGGHRPGRKPLFTVVSDENGGDALGVLKEETNDHYKVLNREDSELYSFPKELLVPFIHNSEIKQYNLVDADRYLIYPRHADQEDKKLLKNYLSSSEELKERHGVGEGTVDYDWFEFGEYRNPELFEKYQKKIYSPYRSTEVSFAISNTKFHGTSDISIIAPKEETKISLEYVLGILNSKLIDFWFREAGKMKGAYMELFPNPLSRIPVRNIDLSKEKEKRKHDKVVEYIEDIQTLKNQEEWLRESFLNMLKSYDLTDEDPLSYFFDPRDKSKVQNFKVNVAETQKIDSEETGVIKEYKVDIEGLSVIVLARYKDESRFNEVLNLNFNDDKMRDYFYLALKRKEGKKNYRSEKKVYNTATDDMQVPISSQTNLIGEIAGDFRTLIEVLQDEFEAKERWNESPVKKMSLAKIEAEIKERKQKIDEIVYDLYGLTDEEIETVESAR